MKTKKKINSTIAAWAVLGIAICFCGFMVFMAVRTNRLNKKERLRETVEYYATAYEDEWNFKNYMAADINKDNSYYKLRDGLHPTFNTNMEFAWLVAEKIS